MASKQALPSLSIVIPSYNGRAHLERCLPAVRAHAPVGTQVIVVDDGSTDDTVAWLRDKHPWVESLELSSNGGFCVAVNAGIGLATGEVVELLNNDTEVQPGWAEYALAHFANPAIGSVAPLTLWMSDPDRVDSAGQEYHVCGWAKNRGYGLPRSSIAPEVGDVFGATGACGFYRRSLLQRTGGLWPLYGAYFEDTDLAFQYRWAGYRCVFEPASEVLHAGTASYGKQPDRLTKLLSRNEEIVFWTNLPLRTLCWAAWLHGGFQAIRLFRQTLKGQLGPFLMGKWQALATWREILKRRRFLAKLADEQSEPVILQLDSRMDVLRQGWTWMTQRRSA